MSIRRNRPTIMDEVLCCLFRFCIAKMKLNWPKQYKTLGLECNPISFFLIIITETAVIQSGHNGVILTSKQKGQCNRKVERFVYNQANHFTHFQRSLKLFCPPCIVSFVCNDFACF